MIFFVVVFLRMNYIESGLLFSYILRIVCNKKKNDNNCILIYYAKCTLFCE